MIDLKVLPIPSGNGLSRARVLGSMQENDHDTQTRDVARRR